jgi:hypothetical protein
MVLGFFPTTTIFLGNLDATIRHGKLPKRGLRGSLGGFHSRGEVIAVSVCLPMSLSIALWLQWMNESDGIFAEIAMSLARIAQTCLTSGAGCPNLPKLCVYNKTIIYGRLRQSFPGRPKFSAWLARLRSPSI